MEQSAYLKKLLESEIKEVLGCTEPASVAFAFARAVKIFKDKYSRGQLRSDFKAEVTVSRDVFRNISTVRVPVVKLKGIAPAASCGIYTKAAGFNPFSGIAAAEKRKIGQLLRRKNWLKVAVRNVDGIFVDARIKGGGEEARVVVEGSHDNIKAAYFNGRKISQRKAAVRYKLKSMDEVLSIVRRRDKGLEDIAEKFLVNQGKLYEQFRYTDAFEAVSGLVEKRMDGASLRVITVTGSGNQGIFIGIPFYRLYKKRGGKILPAALFSLLSQIYLTHGKGRISSDCGLAAKASAALVGGLSFLQNFNMKKITANMDFTQKALKGLLCEGAEPVCAMKARLALTAVKNIVCPKGELL